MKKNKYVLEIDYRIKDLKIQILLPHLSLLLAIILFLYVGMKLELEHSMIVGALLIYSSLQGFVFRKLNYPLLNFYLKAFSSQPNKNVNLITFYNGVNCKGSLEKFISSSNGTVISTSDGNEILVPNEILSENLAKCVENSLRNIENAKFDELKIQFANEWDKTSVINVDGMLKHFKASNGANYIVTRVIGLIILVATYYTFSLYIG